MLDAYTDIISEDGKKINKNVLKQFLKDHAFNVPDNKVEVSDFIKSEVENILGADNLLTKLLLLLFYYNVIKVSDNSNNNFTREKELKVYNVDFDKLIPKIEDEIPSKKLYTAEIRDVYYDFSDLSLKKGKNTSGIKSSIRIRDKKIITEIKDGKEIKSDGSSKYYCTIKKENPDNNSDILKDVYEFEFLLTNPLFFNNLIQLIGLHTYKSKVKFREAHIYGDVSFDLDTYYIGNNNVEKIDDSKRDIEKIDVLEIETIKESYLKNIFYVLGIDDDKKYPKSKDGFGKMFSYFNYKIQKLIKK